MYHAHLGNFKQKSKMIHTYICSFFIDLGILKGKKLNLRKEYDGHLLSLIKSLACPKTS